MGTTYVPVERPGHWGTESISAQSLGYRMLWSSRCSWKSHRSSEPSRRLADSVGMVTHLSPRGSLGSRVTPHSPRQLATDALAPSLPRVLGDKAASCPVPFHFGLTVESLVIAETPQNARLHPKQSRISGVLSRIRILKTICQKSSNFALRMYTSFLFLGCILLTACKFYI